MKRSGRHIDGLLILDKDPQLTSNGALQRVRRLYNAAKAGHTGSLDPAATGVLPICFGRATKLAAYLLNADKTYGCSFVFGEMTDTGDREGRTIGSPGAQWLTRQKLQRVLKDFSGRIRQVPPMYSAVKIDGQPLYRLARKGIEVERKSREVFIHELSMSAFRPGVRAEAELNIRCSKGTYIRTLAEDIGKVLGCGAFTGTLRRLAVGDYRIEDSVTMQTLSELKEQRAYTEMDALLLPMESAVAHFPMVRLSAAEGLRLLQGRPVRLGELAQDETPLGIVRLHQDHMGFVGLGELGSDGLLVSRCRVVGT